MRPNDAEMRFRAADVALIAARRAYNALMLLPYPATKAEIAEQARVFLTVSERLERAEREYPLARRAADFARAGITPAAGTERAA